MNIKTAVFIKSATQPSEYSQESFPEIAFVGRSNVGKSSLINTLVNRKSLAKTSSTPGKTQLINFFVINDKLSFVDLPGYGYAKVPEEIRKKWKPMIETYLLTRKSLRAVVFILDIRRTPDTSTIELSNWLNINTIPVIYVVTKADKLSKTKQIQQKAVIVKTLQKASDDFILFSAKTGGGKEIVWSAIKRLAGAP